ncbi:hypothetical protein CSV69_14310 [Sporosarcina sp. P26b]|uniref:hypothetical protein n=1 Tax=unclassified Sporosarcina TaxID=2647733 RepID=UPI000C171085|nr:MULTISPECIES: hypothetical protein [unclassified Sporosarcina]PIC74080.1 hypothetical protein CSV76_06190 [Sporosarcina sp. P17b]PIC94906.1 hypothetical protein CSV69_14310 [Sporosarcina sp. P26b]
MKNFIEFLEKLERNKIYYTLDKTRDEYVRVDISVPGERWEVEFAAEDSDIVVERFKSVGDVEGEEAIKYLFDNFSD